MSDIARADVLFCRRQDNHTAQVLLHARPHSIASVFKSTVQIKFVEKQDAEPLFAVFNGRRYGKGVRDHRGSEGAPVVQEAFAISDPGHDSSLAMLVETNLLENERMRRRHHVFRAAVRDLEWMATRGEPEGAQELQFFGEYDGVLVVDPEQVIRYMSGIAVNLYRNIGYTEQLIGKPLSYLETIDDQLAREAIQTNRCRRIELEERARTWIKQAVPLIPAKQPLWRNGRGRTSGVLLLIHDDTDERRREKELQIKTTMIKEVHHRVKNDLQTLAALLRMQSRRARAEETRSALGEAVSRIMSIAVIHEFLSEQDTRIINLREVSQRIMTQMQNAVLDPSRPIRLSLTGPSVLLPARQATSCALVINELLQNALEHGFESRAGGGSIDLTFVDDGEQIKLTVHDDGEGLPADFDLMQVDSLGLRIVRMLVQDDLKGHLEYKSNGGVSAIVRFPKITLGGESAWTEPA